VIYLSVCAGIEAATVAWHPLGFRPWAFAEIDRFPSAVLAHHYPDTPNLGDMTKFQEWPDAAVDVLIGGTPCQSFSVAGLRAGLDDPRGSLLLVYLAIARRYRPRWVVWENVPGVLSVDGGRAFGSLLGGLAELGYGFAYRVLDAQYFGLAQRRARVFVVGYLGDWRRAAAVLLEPESLSGHPAPRRQAGQGIAGSLAASLGGSDENDARDGRLVANTLNGNSGRMQVESTCLPITSTGPLSHCLNAGGMGRIDYESETLIAHSLRADGFDAGEDGTGRGTPLIVQAFDWQSGGDSRGLDPKDAGGHTNSHANGGVMPAVMQQMSVRRLTPRECERLQGFPDDYTLIPYRGKPASDGPRYKALGNSMAVPVVRWIGRRMQMVDAIEVAA
jgi:DNA (cytosine-5)-methyltransferase 1